MSFSAGMLETLTKSVCFHGNHGNEAFSEYHNSDIYLRIQKLTGVDVSNNSVRFTNRSAYPSKRADRYAYDNTVYCSILLRCADLAL
jgi:hypothetical protein